MVSDYSNNHTNRLNMAIHLLCVPVFAVAFAMFAFSLAQGQLDTSWRFLVVALLAFAFQAMGHKREAVPPEPFSGPANFLKRIFAEQYFKFWRFLFSGDFVRAWRRKA
jgi:Protein of unknown function (DUF962)